MHPVTVALKLKLTDAFESGEVRANPRAFDWEGAYKTLLENEAEAWMTDFEQYEGVRTLPVSISKASGHVAGPSCPILGRYYSDMATLPTKLTPYLATSCSALPCSKALPA